MHSRSSLFVLRSIANRFRDFSLDIIFTRFALHFIPTLIFRLSRDVCLLMPYGTWSSFRVNYLIEKKIQRDSNKTKCFICSCSRAVRKLCFLHRNEMFFRLNIWNWYKEIWSTLFSQHVVASHGKFLLLTFLEFSKHHFLKSTLKCLRTHFCALQRRRNISRFLLS